MGRPPVSARARAALASSPTSAGFHLRAVGDGRCVLAVPAGGLGIVGDAAGARAASGAPGPGVVTLEPRERHGLEILLGLSGELAALAQNGLAAPRVAVLRPGDELRLGAGAPLFVDLYREPPFVLADAEQARAHCALCRGPILAGRRIYRCACGALTHADEPAEGREVLDCALGTCTACGRALVTAAGYVHGIPGGGDAEPQ